MVAVQALVSSLGYRYSADIWQDCHVLFLVGILQLLPISASLVIIFLLFPLIDLGFHDRRCVDLCCPGLMAVVYGGIIFCSTFRRHLCTTS